MANKMVIGIASASTEKLTVGGVIISGAVAQDMEVKVFLLLGGAYAFRKGVAEDYKQVQEYEGIKDEFFKGLENAKIAYWLDAFKNAKEMGNVKIYVCSAAGKIWGADKKEHYVDIIDEFCGIGEYVSSVEEADAHILL